MKIRIVAIGMMIAFGFVARARAESYRPSPSGGAYARGRNSAPTPAPSVPFILGAFESRPSWNASADRAFLQNYGELGVRASADFTLSYQQQFVGEQTKTGQQTFRLDDGYIRLVANNLWKDQRFGRTSFSYEARGYFPTDPGKASRGMEFALRNYLRIIHQVSSNVTFGFTEVLIPHFYRQSGVAGEKPSANPLYENRVYLEFTVSSPKSAWSFNFPLMLSSTLHRDFADDKTNGGAWAQWLEIYPELDLALSKHLTLGVAYESDNILNAQSQPDPALVSDVGSGTLQFVLRASF